MMTIFSKEAFKKALENWKRGNTTTQVTNQHYMASEELRRLQEIKMAMMKKNI